MERHHIFSLVLVSAAISGLLSPLLGLVVLFAPLWWPTWLPGNSALLFYLASLITATTTLLASGVPAAFYRHVFGDPSGRAELWVWALCAWSFTLFGLGLRFGTTGT